MHHNLLYLFTCFKTPMFNGHHDVRRDVRRDIHKGLLKELCARPLVSMPAHGGPRLGALWWSSRKSFRTSWLTSEWMSWLYQIYNRIIFTCNNNVIRINKMRYHNKEYIYIYLQVYMYIFVYIYIYYMDKYTYLFIYFKTPMFNGHHDVRRGVRRDIHKGLLKELCARPLVSMPAHGGPRLGALWWSSRKSFRTSWLTSEWMSWLYQIYNRIISTCSNNVISINKMRYHNKEYIYIYIHIHLQVYMYIYLYIYYIYISYD